MLEDTNSLDGAHISLTTVRIWNRFSVYNFGMHEENFKLKNKFSNFLEKILFFDKKSHICGIFQKL